MIEKKIHTIKTTNFKDESYEKLENMILDLGLNFERSHEMPRYFEKHLGTGLYIWQYPNQLAKLSKYLYGQKISSYLEIGCRFGGTFVFINELLKISNNVQSYACDIIDKSRILEEYELFHDFQYIQDDSKRLLQYLSGNIDLIFIDGDHSYKGVSEDYNIAMQLKPNHIIFHDICNDECPDVIKFWNEIKEMYKYVEFLDQYESVNGNFLGIGVLEINEI